MNNTISRSSRFCGGRNGAVTACPFGVSIDRFLVIDRGVGRLFNECELPGVGLFLVLASNGNTVSLCLVKCASFPLVDGPSS